MPPKAGLDAELHLTLTSWVLIPRLLENFNRTLFNRKENTIEVRKYPKYIANNNDGCSMEIFVNMKV
jgi:hypothetical protein